MIASLRKQILNKQMILSVRMLYNPEAEVDRLFYNTVLTVRTGRKVHILTVVQVEKDEKP